MPRITVKPPTLIFTVLLLILDGSVFSLLTLLAAAIHELGHISVMLIFGMQISEIELTVFGAEIKTPPMYDNNIASAAVYAAGGTANAVSAAVSAALLPESLEVEYFGVVSLALAAVNLLPIRSLDGGEVIGIIFRRLMPLWADVICRAVSAAVLLGLWLVSAYLLLLFGANLSLMLFCMYLFVSLYLNERRSV